MRLFVAVNFDEATKSRLLAVQNRIKAQSARGNFPGLENLHLTLVFIGEAAAALVPEIVSIVKNSLVPLPGAFTVNLSRTGCFRRGGKELWWVGPALDGSADPGIGTLAAIRQRMGDGLDAAGIHHDRRPFKAHITLGREIRPLAPIAPVEQRLCVPVTRVSLMQSERIRGALAYTELFGQELA
jgi:2'-5' RNA ligase